MANRLAFIKTALNESIYQLMMQIIDKRHMSNLVLSCDIDLKQMPLGKIKKKQI